VAESSQSSFSLRDRSVAVWLLGAALWACSSEQPGGPMEPAGDNAGAVMTAVAGSAPLAPRAGSGSALACVPGGLIDDEFNLPPCPDAGDDERDAAADAAVGQPPDACIERRCTREPITGPLDGMLKWSMSDFGGRGYNTVSMQPIVTTLNDDNGDGRIDASDIPDIVVIGGGDDGVSAYVHAISGDGSRVHFSTYVRYLSYASSMAAGDIDGDGRVELVASASERLVALDHQGRQRWLSPLIPAHIFDSSPWIADLDGDGTVEVGMGGVILNGRDGRLRIELAIQETSPWESLPVDLDGDGIMEIVFAHAAYRLDGTELWKHEPAVGGYLAVADFDGDQRPEIVAVGNGRVRLLDANGEVLWSVAHGPGGTRSGGPPIIADFDGDTEPEIGVAARDVYTVFKRTGDVLWQAPVEDNSSFTGSVAFDFDGDGSAEVVHAGTTTLSVLSGVDGTVRFQAPRVSPTGKESPTVADIDGDGRAEIVVPNNDWLVYRGGLDVYGSASWAPAARSWNQYAYATSNAEVDGRILSAPTPSWLEHNTFRAAGRPIPPEDRDRCGCE
jgi:hypothetical protein